MKHKNIWLIISTSLTLAACGGGSGTGSGPGTVLDPSVPVPPVVLSASETTALNTGDVSGLDAKSKITLLQQAQKIATDVRTQQIGTLSKIYQKNAADLDVSLTYSNNSISVSLQNSTSGMSFLTADNGNGMAALSQVGNGRGMAYGADVLSWMAGSTTQQQHVPLFTRAFTWLMTGDADRTLPATIKFSQTGYSAANIKALATRLGSQAQELPCNLTDVNNSCWQNADLLAFGGGTEGNPNLTALVQKYLAAGKAVVFMAPSWIESNAGHQVLAAMGMELGGYAGNYFQSAAGLSISNTRTVADHLNRADKMGALIGTIQKLMDDNLDWDFKADATPTAAITQIHNELASLHGRGLNLFQQSSMDLHKTLVLWADLWRPSIDKYGKMPPEQRATAKDFLRAYASDSWVVYNREKTTVAPLGYGDFMPKEAVNIAVSADWEELDVTIAQDKGITAIGRAAIPGKAVTLQLISPVPASLGVQAGYARTWGDPLTDGSKYGRPRRPTSFNTAIMAGVDNPFVSPFGGPLYLNYVGLSAGSIVKLRIKGAAKYGHFDFTKTPDQAELDAASAAIKAKTFGWQTAKFVGAEIHQLNSYALAAIGNAAPQTYVIGQIKEYIFNTNHLANGYNNMPMSAAVSTLCNEFSWDCIGNIHRAPGVQHFVGWIATCGYLCSGNPADGWVGIDTGWGWAHELGHNTVQRVHRMLPPGSKGCNTECDNNILANAQMMRKYALGGGDNNGASVAHDILYKYLTDSRATGATGDALRQTMQGKLWDGDDNAKRAVHFQLAFMYTKYRRNLALPTMESSLEYLTLLAKGDRLVAKDWTVANAAKYGMGHYASNEITNHDLLYVLSSRIIGKDMRKFFVTYGLPLDQKSLDSIADLNLPVASLEFYAIAAGKGNHVSEGKWLDIEMTSPVYPF